MKARRELAALATILSLGCGPAAELLPAEACNYRDDDGDGQVDEGFDWVVEPRRVVWKSTREYASGKPVYVASPKAVALSTGGVALAFLDGAGVGTDRGYLLVFDSRVTMQTQVFAIAIGNKGGTAPSLVEDGSGRVLAVFGSTDYEGNCSAPCLVYGLTVDAISGVALQPPGTKLSSSTEPIVLPLGIVVDVVGTVPRGLVRTEDVFGVLSGDHDGKAHFSWLGEKLERIGKTAEAGPFEPAAMGGGPDRRLAFLGKLRDQRAVALSLEAADIQDPDLLARDPVFRHASSEGGLPDGQALAWSGGTVAAAFDDAAHEPSLVLVDEAGVVTGPRTFAVEQESRDVLRLDAGYLFVTADVAAGHMFVHRVSAALRPVATPGGSAFIEGVDSGTTVATSAGIFIFHPLSNQGRIDVTRIHCPDGG